MEGWVIVQLNFKSNKFTWLGCQLSNVATNKICCEQAVAMYCSALITAAHLNNYHSVKIHEVNTYSPCKKGWAESVKRQKQLFLLTTVYKPWFKAQD